MNTKYKKKMYLVSTVVGAVGLFALFLLIVTAPAQSARSARLVQGEEPVVSYVQDVSRVEPLLVEQPPKAVTADWIEIDQAGPETVYAGDTITYTIWVTNTSGGVLSGVSILDNWATDMYQEIDDELWGYGILAVYEDENVDPYEARNDFSNSVDVAQQQGAGVWLLNDLADGATVELVLKLTVPITLQPTLKDYSPDPLGFKYNRIGPSTVANSVFADADGRERVAAPPLSTQVVAPLLKFEKYAQGETAGIDEARVGRMVTLTAIITNVNEDLGLERPDAWPARHFRVYDQMPEGPGTQYVSFVTATASVPGVTVVHTPGIPSEVLWVFPDTYVLDVGKAVTVNLVVSVPVTMDYNRSPYELKDEAFVGLADGITFRPASVDRPPDVKLLSPFDKEVVTRTPPEEINYTYPNRIITYTLTYYSPLTRTSVVTIVDELSEHFSFVRIVEGDLVTPDLVELEGSKLWWTNIPVEPRGIISVVFEVLVSPQTPVRDECTSYLEYVNGVVATSPEYPVSYYDGHDRNKLAPVRVVSQIIIDKDANPNTQIMGEVLEYVISVRNEGDTPIHAPMVLTDQLPLPSSALYFSYTQMASGPPPIEPQVISNTILRWDDVLGGETLYPGQEITFAFEVIPTFPGRGIPNVVTGGYNAETSICQKTNRVTILSPIVYNKTADPEVVMQGDTFSYTLQMWNRSRNFVFTVTEFVDHLFANSKGFIDPLDGDGDYEYTLPAPFLLLPEEANLWEHTFSAHVEGEGFGTSWCDVVGVPQKYKAEKWQLSGDIEAYLAAPVDDWALNGDDAGEVCVFPHVSLFQIAHPNPIAVGQVFTIEWVLRDNRTNPVADVTGIQIRGTLPVDLKEGDFVLLGSSHTFEEEGAGEGTYLWSNISVPKGGTESIYLSVKAPFYEKPGDTKTYSRKFLAEIVAMDDASICIPMADNFLKENTLPDNCDYGLEGLKMTQGIEIDKLAEPKQVGPYGLVEFTLKVENTIGAPVRNVVITDVLPSYETADGIVYPWEYLYVVDGPEPESEDPLTWAFDVISAETTIPIIFRARADYWVAGRALNLWEGEAPIHMGPTKYYTDNASVVTVPGTGFYKVAIPDNIAAGETTVYTITLYNGTGHGLSNIKITDTLPISFTFMELLEGPEPETPDGQTIIWDVPQALEMDKTMHIVYRAKTGESMFSGTYFSQMEAEALNDTTGENVIIPEAAETAPVRVRGKPRVEIDKTVTPNNVLAGENVTYTITLANDTPDTYDLIVTDTLPAFFVLDEALAPSTALTVPVGLNQQVIWSGLTINPNQEINLRFRVHISREAPTGSYSNKVQVQMDDAVLPTESGLATVVVSELPRTDGQIMKMNGTSWVEAGDTLEYTIYYTNATTDPYTGTFYSGVITETFYPITLATVTSPGWYDLGNGTYTRTIDAPLTPGESGYVTFAVKLANTIPSNILGVRNRAKLAYVTTEDIIEGTPNDNVAEDVDIIKGRDIVTVTKTSTPQTVRPGGIITYTITARLISGVQETWTTDITDLLPTGFTLDVPVSPTEGVEDHGTSIVWRDVVLRPGESVNLVFRVKVAPSALAGSRYNRVQVEAGGFELPVHDELAEVEILPIPQVDVQVSKDDGVESVKPGDWVTYTIYYTSAFPGPELMTLILTETLDPGAYVDVLDSSWVNVRTGQYRREVAGPIRYGDTGVVNFPVRIDPGIPAVAEIVNHVEVGYISTEEGTMDVDLDNNTWTDTDVLTEVTGIQATKLVEPVEVLAGEEVVYTIKLRNTDDVAHTLRVTDTLPLKAEYARAINYPSYVSLRESGERQKIAWDGVAINPGDSLQLQFVAKVDRDATNDDDLCNSIQVRRDTTVQPQIDSLACLEIIPLPRVDAQVVKDDGVDWLTDIKRLTYTVQYSNSTASDHTIHNIVLTDTISVVLTETLNPTEYLTPLVGAEWSATFGGSWQTLNANEGRYILFNAGSLEPGETRVVTFGVILGSNIPTDAIVINTVDMGYTTYVDTVEDNTLDNTSSDADYYSAPDLLITDLSFDATEYNAGVLPEATFVVENQGNAPANRRWDGGQDRVLFASIVYLKAEGADPPVDVFDFDDWYCMVWHTDPLAAQSNGTFTCSRNENPPPAGRYQSYIQVDVTGSWLGIDNWNQPFGLIREVDEENNIYTGPIIEVTATRAMYLPLVVRLQ